MALRPGGILHTREGRLRLGWRLGLFLAVTIAVAAAMLLVLPATIPGSGAATLLGALVGGWTVLRVEGRPAAFLGFSLRGTAAREAGAGFALGTAVALGPVAVMALAGAVTWSAGGVAPGAYLLAAGAALVFFVLPAAAEEALFRGYPLQALAEAMGAGRALVLTSVLFGAAHLANPGADAIAAANVTVAGLFLGALLLRTGSLWWASGAHLGWNWAHGFLADLPVSGLELADAPGVVARLSGPDWLSGGDFGPEGSLITTAMALAATAWVWWTPRLRPPVDRPVPPWVVGRDGETDTGAAAGEGRPAHSTEQGANG